MTATSAPSLMVFSKHLAGPPLPEVGRRLREMDIAAVDLTVRTGGHVDPETVRDALPRAAEALASQGVAIGMITTEITSADASTTRPILETTRGLNIRYYKLGYWRYRGFGSLLAQRNEVAAALRDLAAMNLELGLTAGYHNHSHDFVGACLHDVAALLEDVPQQAIGAYLDPCHATIEGGSSGWLMGMDLLRDRVAMLAVKDFRWLDDKTKYAGGRRHSAEFCPLEVGNTPWPDMLRRLRTIGFDGPISLHSEYQGRHSFADLSTDAVFAQTRRDADLFRQWWNAV